MVLANKQDIEGAMSVTEVILIFFSTGFPKVINAKARTRSKLRVQKNQILVYEIQESVRFGG